MDAVLVFLSNKHSKFFDFEINSRRHIIDLAINPSFARTVGFQIHQMVDGSHKVFWNFGMKTGEKFDAIVQHFKENAEYRDKMNAPLTEILPEICSDARFAARIKSKLVIHSADLSEADMKLVDAVIDANWENIPRHYGLDGHSYTVKIYGERIKIFKCYCNIDERQTALIPLVDFLIDIADLTPRNCYEVSSIDGKYRHPSPQKIFVKQFIELPPWMQPPAPL